MLLGADRQPLRFMLSATSVGGLFSQQLFGAACVWYTLHRHQQEARAICPRPAVRCIWASSSSAPAITWPAGAPKAPSTNHMELPVMQEIARIAERGKFDLLFISNSMVDGSHRPSLVPVPLRTHHPDHRARRLHHACRSRRHGLDQLFRAVQRRPHLRLDRPHQRRARRMERRHQLQPQGGAQLQPGRAHRARTALCACQRVRRCRPRAVGLLGGRRDRRRQGHRPVRRRREGAPAQPPGPVLQGPAARSTWRAVRRAIR